MRAIALTLTLAGLAAATTTCPTFVAQAPAYSVGSIVTYNGANYKLVRTEDNGWIEPSNNYFWQATTETCEPVVPQASNNEVISKLDAVLLKLDGKFKDSRDGKVYKFVKIGGQTWMAQNLNYAADGSHPFSDDADSTSKYGRFYTWNSALTACPTGWHLPSNLEWNALKLTVDRFNGGNTEDAGISLRSIETAGTNSFGFNAQLSGWRAPSGFPPYTEGAIYASNVKGLFWSSKETSAEFARYFRLINIPDSASLSKSEWYKSVGFSVRCLQD